MPTAEQLRSVFKDLPEIPDLGEFDQEEPEQADGQPDEGIIADINASSDTPSTEIGDSGTVSESREGESQVGQVEAKTESTEDAQDTSAIDKSKQYDELNEKWAKDKVGFVKQFMAGLSPEEVAALGVQPIEQPEPVASSWEPQSDGEEWLQQHTAVIESLPAFAQNIDKSFAIRDQYLNDALVSNAALEAQVKALCAILEVQLPDIDTAAVQKQLAAGKSYKDAIKETYKPSLDKAAVVKKQAVKRRPNTPGDQGNDNFQVKPGMSMAEIFDRL